LPIAKYSWLFLVSFFPLSLETSKTNYKNGSYASLYQYLVQTELTKREKYKKLD
jgi:hypothetical protein